MEALWETADPSVQKRLFDSPNANEKMGDEQLGES
jgi:hypothetical protein